MNKATDQGWDQIQDRISQMLGKYIGQELHDSRPQDINYTLKMPPDYKKNMQGHNKSGINPR